MTDKKDDEAKIREYLDQKTNTQILEASEKGTVREEFDFEDLSDLVDLDAQISRNLFETMKDAGKAQGSQAAIDLYLEKQRKRYGSDDEK